MEELLTELEKRLKNEYSLAISLDGRSGTGKSTFSKQIAERFGGVVIKNDDFYSGIGEEDDWKGKTPAEKYDLVIDWRRLRQTVLEPLLIGNSITYHPFDFKKGYGLSEEVVELKSAKVIILEGAYSSRPELQDLIDISVLVKVENISRRKRLVEREGESYMKKWHAIWDESEDYYFDNIRKEEDFDYTFHNV